MDIRTLQRGLKYCGQVKAVRQTYHVFEAERYFFVLSFARSKTRRGSGYFNVIDRAAVDYVRQRMAATRAVTAKDVLAAARRTRYIPTALVALNVLYILVVLRSASIVRSGEHRQLIFSMKRAAPAKALLRSNQSGRRR